MQSRGRQEGQGICDTQYCRKEKPDHQLKQQPVSSSVRSLRTCTTLEQDYREREDGGFGSLTEPRTEQNPKEKSGFKGKDEKQRPDTEPRAKGRALPGNGALCPTGNLAEISNFICDTSPHRQNIFIAFQLVSKLVTD